MIFFHFFPFFNGTAPPEKNIQMSSNFASILIRIWNNFWQLLRVKNPEFFFSLHPSVRGWSTQQVLRSGIATAPPIGRLCEILFAWLTFVPGFKSFLHLTIWCVRGRSTHKVLRSGIATAPPFGRLCEKVFAWLTFVPGFKSFLHLTIWCVRGQSTH